MGTSIAVIVGLGGLSSWPELVAACVQSLEGSDTNALEGSLDALYKVGWRTELTIFGNALCSIIVCKGVMQHVLGLYSLGLLIYTWCM